MTLSEILKRCRDTRFKSISRDGCRPHDRGGSTRRHPNLNFAVNGLIT